MTDNIVRLFTAAGTAKDCLSKFRELRQNGFEDEVEKRVYKAHVSFIAKTQRTWRKSTLCIS
ncbi:MAG: hypothetical protein ACFFFG_00405 [Candidatus Thorarchaeota archaeon]